MLDPTAATESTLDIESIKALLDGFDPEAILPEMDSIFDKIWMICRISVMIGPVILILLGLAYLFLSPKEANYYFGYRCYFGMGSAHAWRFTQRIAGILLSVLGVVLTIVMFVISNGFATMAMMDMVWKAVRCLIWEAGLALLATLLINGAAMFWFNRKGELRSGRRQKPKKST